MTSIAALIISSSLGALVPPNSPGPPLFARHIEQVQGTPVQPTDPVGKTMTAAKLLFSDIGGFYKMKYDFTDTKRSQFAFVRQEVYAYNSLSVQEAYALVYEDKTAPDGEVLLKLFQKSFGIGGLVLEAPSDKQVFWRIRFRIEIPTNSTPERVKTYISLVVGTADATEKELGAEDKL